MARADQRRPLALEVQHGVRQRRHLMLAERSRQPVEPLHHARGVCPSSAYARRPVRIWAIIAAAPMPCPITSPTTSAISPRPTVNTSYQSPPIPAPHGRKVARRQLQPGTSGSVLGTRLLEHLHHPTLVEQPRVLDRRRGAVGGGLQQVGVGVA